MGLIHKITLFALIAILSSAASAHASASYNVTDLGSLGAIYDLLYINNNGQIVGEGYGPGNAIVGQLYDHGNVTNLGTLQPSGINNNGQVIGTEVNSLGINDAFIYYKGSLTDLGNFGGPSGSYPAEINSNGQVVGYSAVPSTTTLKIHPFIYITAPMTDLNLGLGSANGITDLGQIAGWYTTSTGADHAFLYSNGSMTDLGTLGGTNSYATGINASGQIVGRSDLAGGSGSVDAFLYANGTMIDIAPSAPGSTVGTVAINDLGQVIGTITPPLSSPPGTATESFLYFNGSLSNLNTLTTGSGWTIEGATGINDLGQIVGYGQNPSGTQDGFLLTPISVPEPASAVLVVMAICALLCSRPRTSPDLARPH